jgi:hypothetical protein
MINYVEKNLQEGNTSLKKLGEKRLGLEQKVISLSNLMRPTNSSSAKSLKIDRSVMDNSRSVTPNRDKSIQIKRNIFRPDIIAGNMSINLGYCPLDDAIDKRDRAEKQNYIRYIADDEEITKN